MQKVGFIGLGNVGGKLAGSLIRNGCNVVLRDLNRDTAATSLLMLVRGGRTARKRWHRLVI